MDWTWKHLSRLPWNITNFVQSYTFLTRGFFFHSRVVLIPRCFGWKNRDYILNEARGVAVCARQILCAFTVSQESARVYNHVRVLNRKVDVILFYIRFVCVRKPDQ